MKTRKGFTFARESLPALMLLGLFAVLWQSVQAAALLAPDETSAAQRTIEALRQAAPAVLRPGDRVFLSSQNPMLLQTISALDTSLYEVNALDTKGAEAALLHVMDDFCARDHAQAAPSTYWIWTADDEQTTLELGSVARALNFLFAFEAVLPYRGDDALAIDKFLRLQPKESVFQSYCEAAELAGDRPVLVILDSAAFSPWIGSVVTGRVTWLAASPERHMLESQFAVAGMPPLLTYDVFWLSQVPYFGRWEFPNQDKAAYELAVANGKARDSLVLVDREAVLGTIARSHLAECRGGEPLLKSRLFRQMCFK